MTLKNNLSKKSFNIILWICLALIVCGVVLFYILPKIYGQVEYESLTTSKNDNLAQVDNTVQPQEVKEENKIEEIPVTHIETPSAVKAIYLSGWVAGSSKLRDNLIRMIDDTELNAVVIDVKDSTGIISFKVQDEELKKFGSDEKRIADIRALTHKLHEKGVYIIGRISVFQDPYMTKHYPEFAITKKSDGSVWKDRKGLSFLDPAKSAVHDYIIRVAKEAYNQGFDEINFDYIRYPSDGNMQDIDYHLEAGKTRADNIEAFFKYLNTEMKKDVNIPISGDLFGLTTEAKDDMGIGQVWEKAIPYFDFLCPMVYPSHYPSGYNGYSNPASYPYEVINRALVGAISKTTLVNENISKIRPWLQDFDLGATYTADMIKKQIKATYDNKLSSWMLWDPSNKYTESALIKEKSNTQVENTN